jgi:hypothetical protein
VLATGLAAGRFVLPVSGLAVSLRQPTGAEDVLLADHAHAGPALVLALIELLAAPEPQTGWGGLSVTDIDTLVMRLRQMVVGGKISASLTCGVESCGAKVEISFGIEAYLTHHRPRAGTIKRHGWSAAPCADAPGWFALSESGGEAVKFRLPTLADQIAVAGLPDAPASIAERCLGAARPSSRVLSRVETAMTAFAPPLSGPLHGACPDCGAPITAQFEARSYCLQELRDRARFVYDDIDTLAERYHWSERAILKLPFMRRVMYAERARQARAG